VVELESTTRQNYVVKLNKHVRPVLGKLPVAKLDAEKLESFYATLRRCDAATLPGAVWRAKVPAAPDGPSP
jgi:hypothetical protein